MEAEYGVGITNRFAFLCAWEDNEEEEKIIKEGKKKTSGESTTKKSGDKAVNVKSQSTKGQQQSKKDVQQSVKVNAENKKSLEKGRADNRVDGIGAGKRSRSPREKYQKSRMTDKEDATAATGGSTGVEATAVERNQQIRPRSGYPPRVFHNSSRSRKLQKIGNDGNPEEWNDDSRMYNNGYGGVQGYSRGGRRRQDGGGYGGRNDDVYYRRRYSRDEGKDGNNQQGPYRSAKKDLGSNNSTATVTPEKERTDNKENESEGDTGNKDEVKESGSDNVNESKGSEEGELIDDEDRKSPELEEPTFTLKEWKALQAPRDTPVFNIRKAGEGEPKLANLVLKKKDIIHEEQEEEYEVEEIYYPQRAGRMKLISDVGFTFKQKDEEYRGRRGGGRMRGPAYLGGGGDGRERFPDTDHARKENENRPFRDRDGGNHDNRSDADRGDQQRNDRRDGNRGDYRRDGNREGGRGRGEHERMGRRPYNKSGRGGAPKWEINNTSDFPTLGG